MRRILIITAMLVGTASFTASADARLIVGIGDQNAATFDDANFKKLGVKRTRYIVPFDAITKDAAGVDAWMQAARRNGLDPVIAFNPTRGSRCPSSPCSVPSPAAYTSAFKKWRAKYPYVKVFNFWNETNSPTQPTSSIKSGGKAIKKSAALYRAALKVCGRKCTVTGPDMLDLGIGDPSAKTRRGAQKRMKQWIAIFTRAAKKYPKVWGFHNYGDTNYSRSTGTKFFLKAVRGDIHVTETGGIYSLRLQNGKQTFKPNGSRQAKAVKFTYTIANKYRSRIKRLYYYQWRQTNPSDFWDSGVVDFNGGLRPAYTALLKLKKIFR
jgi:hypothetical protein